MRVLVVEDHVELAETVASVLRREGIAVDVAHDGSDALSRSAALIIESRSTCQPSPTRSC